VGFTLGKKGKAEKTTFKTKKIMKGEG